MSIEKAKGLVTKSMTSHGIVYSVPDLHKALEDWEPSLGYINLAHRIWDATGNKHMRDEDRIADRLIQKLRKEGLIRHLGRGVWEWAQ